MILITGASGMVGSTLTPILRSKGMKFVATDIDLSLPGVSYLDVRDFDEVEKTIAKFAPSNLIHLAAETDVDKCEANPNHAYETNTLGVQNVAVSCNRLQIPITYVSTAGVFNGKKNEPYNEFDTPDPVNAYGRSKYQGELLVRALVSRHFIVRAGWMVGGRERDKKFVAKIVKQLRDGKTTIYGVKDKLGTPTYAKDFCEHILRLIETPYWGTYHIGCKGTGTRFDVAAHIVKTLGFEDIKLIPVTSAHFEQEYPAPRPRSEMMENLMLELRRMNTMRHWKDALVEYLDQYRLVIANR